MAARKPGKALAEPVPPPLQPRVCIGYRVKKIASHTSSFSIERRPHRWNPSPQNDTHGSISRVNPYPTRSSETTALVAEKRERDSDKQPRVPLNLRGPGPDGAVGSEKPRKTGDRIRWRVEFCLRPSLQ